MEGIFGTQTIIYNNNFKKVIIIIIKVFGFDKKAD